MKLLKIILLLAFFIVSIYASGGDDDNVITYYGCPDECHTQKSPSCPKFDDDNLPSHFAALSTSLSGYEDYCGNYAIYMMADGSNVETIARATVVDSCGGCSKYHLDLSIEAFKEVRQKGKGTGEVIWGIYSKSGTRLAGPYYNSVSGSAKKLGMSSDSFISAFDANAKSLASGSSSSKNFNSSDSDKTTTTITVTTTATTTTTTTTIATTPGTNSTSTSNSKAPQKTPATKSVTQVINEDTSKDGNNIGTTVGLLALGGGCIGAAGAGLIFMKKNPNTYKDMKQKFPEAFTNVKRGLSRRATSLKRRVTKKVPNSSADAIKDSSADIINV